MFQRPLVPRAERRIQSEGMPLTKAPGRGVRRAQVSSSSRRASSVGRLLATMWLVAISR